MHFEALDLSLPLSIPSEIAFRSLRMKRNVQGQHHLTSVPPVNAVSSECRFHRTVAFMAEHTLSTGQSQDGSGSENSPFVVPQITLPKGGGAIRGIGEKFSVGAVTGTSSLAVAIAVTPIRSEFSPQLSLSYISGIGKGPFGIGWSLSAPSITRKTEKGLPKYQDSQASAVFIVSEAEDLVPVLKHTERGDWVDEEQSGCSRQEDGGYLKKSLPSLDFEYISSPLDSGNGHFAPIERISPKPSSWSPVE